MPAFISNYLRRSWAFFTEAKIKILQLHLGNSQTGDGVIGSRSVYQRRSLRDSMAPPCGSFDYQLKMKIQENLHIPFEFLFIFFLRGSHCKFFIGHVGDRYNTAWFVFKTPNSRCIFLPFAPTVRKYFVTKEKL